MIMTGQNTWNTENRWTVSVCEAHRVREEYIHPSAHHTQANVDIKEENSGPKNIMVDESDFDHLTRIDRIQFYSIPSMFLKDTLL